jgi:pimeloyl-ACP methyl ester carboxylesterase
VIWGEGDVLAPLGGPVGQFFVSLADTSDSKVAFERIPNCGHVPFDDNPELSNGVMISWLEKIAQAKNGVNIQQGNVFEGLRTLFGR